jgi:hypothetical protein
VVKIIYVIGVQIVYKIWVFGLKNRKRFKNLAGERWNFYKMYMK